jgi:hypothetical protein
MMKHATWTIISAAILMAATSTLALAQGQYYGY